MEVTKRVNELEPTDRAVVERLLGQPLVAGQEVVLVLRNEERPAGGSFIAEEVPGWFRVLEGMSDEDLAEFNAIIQQGVTLAHPQSG